MNNPSPTLPGYQGREYAVSSLILGRTKVAYRLAFTLVELIVVVTILAILATIGFVSYSSYLTGVRDTNRLAQLVAIHDGMELYRTKNDLPLPDENISIMASGAIIAYQGYAGSNTLETIDFTKGGKDPKDGDYFSYYLTQDRKYFQLLAFLEEEENLSAQNPFTPSLGRGGLGRGIVNAADLSNRISTVYGKKLGVMTDSDNTPIQELVSGSIDLVDDDTTGYVAHLTDTSTLTGSTAGNSDLAYLENTGIGGGMAASCKTIIDRNKSVEGKDGTYLIDPEGNNPFPVYCDMTTEGGGWTLVGNVQTTNASIVVSSYEDGLSTPDLADLDSGAWLLDVDTYKNAGTVIRTDFSGQNDYYKPISGSNVKEMLQSFNKHQWSNNPDHSFITPAYYTAYVGGSAAYYPRDYIAGDSRPFLPFWGGATNSSGHDGSTWNQTFKLYIR